MEQIAKTNDINTLTAEILILKQQTAQNIIEIGKRLISVKQSLPHGEWGKWLEEKVDFKKSTANNFMRVANEFSNLQTLGNLSSSKLFALLDLPLEEREDFIKENPIDEMTTRELQKAIREKKDLEDTNKHLKQSFNELSNKYSNLEEKLDQEKNKPAKTVEIDNTDYETINKLKKQLDEIANEKDKIQTRLDLMKNKADAYEQDSLEYQKMKEDITYLTSQKDELGRQLQSITDISGLVVEIDHLIKGKLAPTRYSKSLLEAKDDEIVLRNLTNIVETVEQWCGEMRKYIPRKSNYVEVIE